MSKFGKPSYGGNKKTYIGLKDGDNVYRLVPPLGEQSKGVWSAYYNVHYGYKNSQNRTIPFQSPEEVDRSSGKAVVTVRDAAKDRLTQIKEKLEEAIATNNKTLAEALIKIVGRGKTMGQYNLDSKHYVNAIDLQGNIVVLKIPHRGKLALDETIKRLRAEGKDPLDPNKGLYLNIRRSGTALDTTFQVETYKKTINVQGIGDVQQEVTHAISDALADRMYSVNEHGELVSGEAAILSKLFPRPTASEVERIVKEGAKALDEIFGKKEVVEEVEGDTQSDYTPAPLGKSSTVETVVNAGPITVPTQSSTTHTGALNISNGLNTVTTPTEQALVTLNISSAPKTTAQTLSEMSNEDFLKSMGFNA